MPQHQQTDTIRGVLEKILYSNEENHYLVGHVRTDCQSNQTTIVTGKLFGIQCGETLEMQGNWTQHPKFGRQFTVQSFRSTLPANAHGIRKYLGSGLIHGIGSTYANKIVDFFGDKTLEIISHQSARLQEVPGIGKRRAKSIKQAWDEQQHHREVMIFLQTHNVSTNQCIRLVKKYGEDTIPRLREDPYILAREVDGIGFLTADRIAHNLGIPSNSEKRIRAGVFHLLSEAGNEGHTGLPAGLLLDQAVQLLDLESTQVRELLENLFRDKELIHSGDTLVQLPNLDRWESQIARAIANITHTQSRLPPIQHEKAVDWFESKTGFQLAPEQRSSIIQALASKLAIITGGPGTGKTTLLRALVAILRAKKVKVSMASPTGRASKRLSEATGGHAQTIHRLLGYDPINGGFIHNDSNPLRAEFVIVDEASMLDTQLAACLFRAVPASSHLILVGDTDQLPSVGSGNVLSDLIQSGLIPVTRLNYIHRQSRGSRISSVAHDILQNRVHPGKMVDTVQAITREDEIVFVKCESPDKLLEQLNTLITRTLPTFIPPSKLADVQILVPLHKGACGTQNLNLVMQQTLNPHTQTLQLQSQNIGVSDRIIQTRNNYEKGVFNGDIGKVVAIDTENGVLKAVFDGVEVQYDRSEQSEFQLAYAITIHKSQGSEYSVVVIPLMNQHFVMLQRNLIYTAITRGKERVYLLGQIEAFAMAVRNNKTKSRQTYLIPRLQKNQL